MAPLTFQLLNPFGKPCLSDVACRRATPEEVIIWYLTVHTGLLGALLVLSLFVPVTRLFESSSRFGRQQDQNSDSAASDIQHPVNELDIQWQYPVLRCRSSRRDIDNAYTSPRGGRTLIPLYELDDTGIGRCRQRDGIPRGIRGGAGDEAKFESRSEHIPTTEEPGHQDDRESAQYLENMSQYLELEDLLEATIDDLDELESHRDATLLREALIRNERRRLCQDYHELKERLDHHMRLLGSDPEELGIEEVDGLGRRR